MQIKKTIFVIALVSLFVTLLFKLIFKEDAAGNIISPLADKNSFPEKIIKAVTPKSGLEKLITKDLEGLEGDYAVVIKNFKTNENYSVNPDTVFSAASLYKLWVMGEAYEEINQGILREADSVSLSRGQIEEIQGFWQEGVNNDSYYSVADAIESMITVSDNDAAITLYTNIGEDKVSEFLSKYNLTNSNFSSPPQTTANDIATFYEKLYKGQIVNREYSQKMLEVLIRQRLNDRIPKYLPEDVKVAHKTGELDGFKHDAGIVSGPNGEYIIVILTNTQDPQTAAENIALISKDVYNYFNPPART